MRILDGGASDRLRDTAALAIFLALTIVMTNPLALYLPSAVEDKQDALLNTWIIAWVGHALITDPLNLFNANIFYPYPNALAFSETMLPQGILALPFNLAFDNTVLGYNLVLLFSFFLAAYAMYLFVFDLTRHRTAAIIAGTIFAFNPYNLGNLSQVQLLSFGWLPLAMMYLRRVLSTGSEKREAKSVKRDFRILNYELRISFIFALFFSLQCLSSFYYAFLAGWAVALYLIWFALARWFAKRNRPTTQPSHHSITPLISIPLRFAWGALGSFQSPVLLRLIFSFALISLFVTPFFLPYLQVQRELGFERKVEESEPFSASLKLFTEVSPRNVLYGNLLAPRPPVYNGGYPLDNLFPGLIALVLAIAGIAAPKNRDKWFYFLLFTLAFVLSLGPRLYITPTQSTALALPYHWLYDLFPLMRALRAPVRFDALVMFAMAMLVGLGARSLPTALRLLPSLLVPFIALEYLAFPAAQITPVPVGDAIPQSVRWLATQPPSVVLELPMMASDPSKPLDLTTQYLTTYHWQKTPDGYSGFNPPRRGEIAYEMKSFPSERSISLLQALKVQYIVIRTNEWEDWFSRREAIGREPSLRLAKQAGSDFIYQVAFSTGDAAPLNVRVYLPQPAAPKQSYLAYFIFENRDAKSVAIQPIDLLQVDARWSDGTTTTQHLTASLPLVTSSVSVVPIRLSAPTREGAYRLDLRVSNRAIGESNISGNVSVQNGEPARQVVIPAGVVLRSPLKSEYTRGDSFAVDVTWLPYNKVDAYYSASVRVVNARGEKIVAQDREPRVSTFLWTPGVTVEDRFLIALPPGIAPGEYSVQLLMYQPEQGTAALLLDETFNPRETILFRKFVVK